MGVGIFPSRGACRSFALTSHVQACMHEGSGLKVVHTALHGPLHFCLLGLLLLACPLEPRQLSDISWGPKDHKQFEESRPDTCCILWKDTKEHLNQRGTKIRVFRVCFRAPFLPPFFPFPPLLSPFKPCSLCYHFSPLHLPKTPILVPL